MSDGYDSGCRFVVTRGTQHGFYARPWHTFLGWSRGLALVQSLVVQALFASFRAVS